MLNKLAFGLLMCLFALDAASQTNSNIQADPNSSAYAQDNRGVVLRSQYGFCWRTSNWTETDAINGCDGQLAHPIANPTAPAIAIPTAGSPSAPVPTGILSTPKRCDFTITLANEQTFGSDRALLNQAAKKYINRVTRSKLSACDKLDKVIITGHTDHRGTQIYNQKLSEKRAGAVATYLKNQKLVTQVTTTGAGATRPIASCDKRLSARKSIECLAPNRRVVIEVRGTAF